MINGNKIAILVNLESDCLQNVEIGGVCVSHVVWVSGGGEVFSKTFQDGPLVPSARPIL